MVASFPSSNTNPVKANGLSCQTPSRCLTNICWVSDHRNSKRGKWVEQQKTKHGERRGLAGPWALGKNRQFSEQTWEAARDWKWFFLLTKKPEIQKQLTQPLNKKHVSVFWYQLFKFKFNMIPILIKLIIPWRKRAGIRIWKKELQKRSSVRGGSSSDISLLACSGRILYPGNTWVERIGAHQRHKNGFPRTPQRTKIKEAEKWKKKLT